MMLLQFFVVIITFIAAFTKALAYSDALIDYQLSKKEHNRNQWWCCQDNKQNCPLTKHKNVMYACLLDLVYNVALFILSFIFAIEPLI